MPQEGSTTGWRRNRIERKGRHGRRSMLHPPPRQFAPPPLTPTGLGAAPLIAIERDFAATEGLWRGFERANPGRLFQRFDWARAWAETQGAAWKVEPAIVILHDALGSPVALLPLCVRRWGQVNIVEWLGGEHASFNLPLLQNGGIPAQDSGATRQLLRAVGRAIGEVDLFALTNQPRLWDGAPHPFAGAGDVDLFDGGYERFLPQGGDPLKSILDRDARKKLRAKERKLSEIGPVAMIRAQSADEIDAMLAAFFAQRRRRFQDARIANPFDEPGAEGFLRRATQTSGAASPAIALYSLSVGSRIAAIFGGPEDQSRFSGMFTSFDDSPEIARNSPGDILLARMVENFSARGISTIDLGVGDARYKRTYCDRRIPMFETHLAGTPAGAIVSASLRARSIAKRAIKRHPALLSFMRRMTAR